MARKNKFQHYEFEVTVSGGHVLPCLILFLLDQCVISQQACCSFPCGAGWGGEVQNSHSKLTRVCDWFPFVTKLMQSDRRQ